MSKPSKSLPLKLLAGAFGLTGNRRMTALGIYCRETGHPLSFLFTLGPLAAVIRLWRWLTSATVLSTWW